MRMDWLRRHKHSLKKSAQGVNLIFNNSFLQQYFDGTSAQNNSFDRASAEKLVKKLGQSPSQALTHSKALLASKIISKVNDELGKINFNPTGGNLFGGWNLWSAGQITIGKSQSSKNSTSSPFEAVTVAVGIDKSDANSVMGFALNVSEDEFDVGQLGSTQNSDGLSLSVYGNYDSDSIPPLEFIFGAGNESILSKRMDGLQTLKGTQKVNSIYGSISVLPETVKYNQVTLMPYGKFEASVSEFGSYSETGGTLALAFGKQNIRQTIFKFGVDATYDARVHNGNLTPFARLEYALDISPESYIDMRYVNDTMQYRLKTNKIVSGRWTARIGANYNHEKSISSSVFYERSESRNHGYSNTFHFKATIPFESLTKSFFLKRRG